MYLDGTEAAWLAELRNNGIGDEVIRGVRAHLGMLEVIGSGK